MLKRFFDVLFAAAALLVLGLPMLVIGTWIRVQSPGPALFRQRRVGLRGGEFEILKFRTMRNDAQRQGPSITVGNDSRVTGCGQFLRKYKLDELPQFINVLKGDMSIVGPRPEVPRYVAMYPEVMRELVLSVRPGMTDLASIEYRNENELLGTALDAERMYIERIVPAKLALYVRYVRERSFLGDLSIIARTFRAAFLPPR